MSPLPTANAVFSSFGKRFAHEPRTSVTLKPILKTAASKSSQKRVGFADAQTVPLPCVPVKSSGFFQGLTADVKLASHKCRAFFDSGTSVNIIKSHVLKNSLPPQSIRFRVIHRTSPLVVSLATLSCLIARSSSVSVCLHLNLLYQICSMLLIMMYAAEILIGYQSMSHFNISLFPSTYQIAQNGTFISASPSPQSPPSPEFYIVTHTSSQDSPHVPPSSLEIHASRLA